MTLRRFVRPEHPKVSIVIPALNEARSPATLLPQLSDAYEVLLVDGSSTDGTVETALRVRPDTRIVHQTRTGKGNALVCGFEVATGDVLVMLDADGSADPSQIPAFVEALVGGADVATGSRFRRGGRGSGAWGSGTRGSGANLGLHLICNLLLDTRYSDLGFGFNAFWRDVLPALDLVPSSVPAPTDGGSIWGDGFEIETVLACRMAAARLRVTELSTSESRDRSGSARSTIGDSIRVLRTVLDERRREQELLSADPSTAVADSGSMSDPVVTAPIHLGALQDPR